MSDDEAFALLFSGGFGFAAWLTIVGALARVRLRTQSPFSRKLLIGLPALLAKPAALSALAAGGDLFDTSQPSQGGSS